MAVTIKREVFDKLAPKSARTMLFEPGSTVNIIELDESTEMDWGDDTVPALKVEVNGQEKEIPAPAIMGAIVSRPGILHNENDGAMECVNFVGNTLHNYLQQTTEEGKDIELPGEIKVIKRVNKGIPKTQVDQKKTVYEESFLVEEGQTFDQSFEKYDFIPTVFKSATGTVRTNGAYMIDALD